MALRIIGRRVFSSVLPQSVCRPQAYSVRQFSVVPVKVDLPKELITPEIEKVVSLETANSKQIYQHKVGLAVKKFQRHKSDTGTMSVQIAVMTEKILNLSRHFVLHKKDKAGKRSFQMLLAKRRRAMQYLMRKDVEEFAKVVQALNLTKEASQLRAK